jgi:hypothetical protein
LVWTKEKEEEFFHQHEVFEANKKKIINANVNQAHVIFPYNQKNLWIPDDKFWLEIRKEMMEKKSLLICSPNALVRARPKLDQDKYLITINEMVLCYWLEIQGYLGLNPNIQKITFICTDINLERIRRDFKIVFQDKTSIITEYNIEEKIRIVPLSFWKIFYKFREAIVFNLPIWLYEFLGRR